MSDEWREAGDLSETMRVLEGLWLSVESRQREAFRQRWVADGSATASDVERARATLLWLVRALTSSAEPERWRALAQAGEILGVQGAPSQPEPEPVTDVDTTLAAATEVQPKVSFDETLSMNTLTLDDDGDGNAPSAQPQHTARGTLLAGEAPELALDVDKYAILCAWTEVHPERRKALHDQYGLPSEEARAELDKRFEARFVSDHELRVAFTQRLRMHLSWLRGTEG